MAKESKRTCILIFSDALMLQTKFSETIQNRCGHLLSKCKLFFFFKENAYIFINCKVERDITF